MTPLFLPPLRTPSGMWPTGHDGGKPQGHGLRACRVASDRAVRRPAQGLGFTVVRLASPALIPAAVIVDLFNPESWPFNRFLVGPPALAAASWSPAGTCTIGIAALATDIALIADKGGQSLPGGALDAARAGMRLSHVPTTVINRL
ncbi:hypothetical protein [Streptomyces sp. NPDC059460]|uniref:hypothetical protein n=1 Tax=Streptomyces sp. NPDC059460 TaxID=3346840 RepID=UPI0036D100EC